MPLDGPDAAGPSGGADGEYAGREVQGHRLILALFLVLALGASLFFAVFAYFLEPEDRGLLLWPVLRTLNLPLIGLGALVAIDAWRRGRSGWWVYLLCAFLTPLNVVLAALWLASWRKRPRRFGPVEM